MWKEGQKRVFLIERISNSIFHAFQIGCKLNENQIVIQNKSIVGMFECVIYYKYNDGTLDIVNGLSWQTKALI